MGAWLIHNLKVAGSNLERGRGDDKVKRTAEYQMSEGL